MKVRVGVLGALLAGFTFALVGCGGGGGSAIVDMTYEGDFFMISGSNIGRLAQSEFLKQGRFKLGPPGNMVDEAFMHNSTPEQFGGQINFRSTKAEENFTYIGWPVTPDYLKQYLEEAMDWEVDEEEDKGMGYFVNDDDDDNKSAAMVVAGGYIATREDSIEDLIKAKVEGKKRLADDKDFQEARQLVDFSANVFSLQWDNLDNATDNLRRTLAENENTRIEDDEDFTDTLDTGNIAAIAECEYYGADFRYVKKILFDKEKNAKEFAEVVNDNKDKLLKKNYHMVLPSRISRRMNAEEARRNMDDLEDKLTVVQRGNIVEITLQITWEDIAEFFERD